MRVYLSSPWIPAEWVRAHQLEPRGLWFAENLRCGIPSISAGVCAWAEGVVRFAGAQPDSAVVFTTACDQLRRGFDAATAHGGSGAFLFNLPATQTSAARQIYRAELERLGRFLLELGGRTPTPEVLRHEMLQADEARERLREAAPNASARSLAEAAARLFEQGVFSAPSAFIPRDCTPLALLGGPLSAPDWDLFDTIEAAGGRVVLNAMENGERSLCPKLRNADCPQSAAHTHAVPSPIPSPILMGEGQGEGIDSDGRGEGQGEVRVPNFGFRVATPRTPEAAVGFDERVAATDALAAGYFENITDVFQRPNTRLHAWLRPRLVSRGARGIVLRLFTGCDLWRAEAESLREAFGLPVLPLETADGAGISAHDVNRLEAFVETLQ
ncbi:MAG: 2-hydroxyacyl-CoA dehydratase family protein [Verrucomicrobiota bacterium]|jgi:hypothetical protein